MLRFLLLVLFGYILWRFLRALFSALSHPQGSGNGWQRRRNGTGESATPRQYMDIKDAEFEDITTDKDAGKPK